MRNIGELAVSKIKENNLGGVVSVLCDVGEEQAAGEVVKWLAQSNFTVKNQNSAVQKDLDDVKELAERLEAVRLIVAVGGEKAVMAAKSVAKFTGAATIAIVTVVDGEGIFDEYAVFPRKNQQIRAPKPTAVAVYEGAKCLPEKCYGRLFYRAMRLIDKAFLQISDGLPPETELFFELMKFFSEPAKTEDFAAALQKVAADDYFPSFAVPSYLTAKEGTEFSESCFLSAAMMLVVYRNYLEKPFIDLLPPPDFTKSFKLLDKNAQWDYNINLSESEFASIDDFLKRKFVLSEYAADLLNMAQKIDLEGIAKKWKRSFKDAGFHLSKSPRGKILVGDLSVASALDGGLLLHVKQSGFFENNI